MYFKARLAQSVELSAADTEIAGSNPFAASKPFADAPVISICTGTYKITELTLKIIVELYPMFETVLISNVND